MNTIVLLQIIFTVVLFVIIILIFRQNVSLKKEKRIGYYSLEPIVDNSLSLSDKFIKKYLDFVKKQRKLIGKSKILRRKSKKYEKYIKYKHRETFEPIDFITNKLIISFNFLLLTIISQVFTIRVLSVYELIINYFIGYYLLDIYLYFDY